MPRHASLRILAAGLLAATCFAGPASAEAAARPVRVLQFNLCNSGHAPCWGEKPGPDSTRAARTMSKVVSVFKSLNPRPSVVVMNEVCSSDLASMKIRLGLDGDSFFTVYKNSAKYTCGGSRNGGGSYGSAILTEAPLRKPYSAYRLEKRFTKQDGSSERRVMGCRKEPAFTVCTGHLSVSTVAVAEAQCRELMSGGRKLAGRGPLIVSGDLNLRWNKPAEQAALKRCLGSGYTRKSDGNRQHVIARDSGHGFVRTGTISMGSYSDHDAFWADLS